MLRTITLGSCVSVQGILVGQNPDGRMMVRVDERIFVGTPVTQMRSVPATQPAAAPATLA